MSCCIPRIDSFRDYIQFVVRQLTALPLYVGRTGRVLTSYKTPSSGVTTLLRCDQATDSKGSKPRSYPQQVVSVGLRHSRHEAKVHQGRSRYDDTSSVSCRKKVSRRHSRHAPSRAQPIPNNAAPARRRDVIWVLLGIDQFPPRSGRGVEAALMGLWVCPLDEPFCLVPVFLRVALLLAIARPMR